MSPIKIAAVSDPHINYWCAHCGGWGMVRTSLFQTDMLCVSCTERGVKGVKAPIDRRIGMGEVNVTKVQDNILGASKMENSTEVAATETSQEEPKAKRTNGIHTAPQPPVIHPSAGDLEAHSAVVSRLRARLEEIPKERSDKCAALDAEEAEILRELGEKPRGRRRTAAPQPAGHASAAQTTPKEPKAKSNAAKAAKPAKTKGDAKPSASQQAVVGCLDGNPWQKVGQIADATGIDSLVVKRELDGLREAGRLKSKGKARAMEYALR